MLARTMPYDESLLRIERFDSQINYHAAYNYWSLRGVLAERWAHGPIFGGTQRSEEQTVLVPPTGPDQPDLRLLAVYGLRAAALNAEGENWVPRAQKLVSEWYSDVLEVLKPKRCVRMSVDVFALYPIDDPIEASTRLRSAFYNAEKVKQILPDDLHERRDDFHAALDFIVPLDEQGSAVSVVVGAVGPLHKGLFFAQPDEARDNQWWLGVRYDRRRIEPEGHKDVLGRITKMAKVSVADTEQVARRVFTEVLK